MNYLHNFCKTYFERRYINSLLAKPFVILSGNSGTGKTKVACKIAKYYHNNIPDYNKSLKDLFKYILEHDYDMNGVRLKSVSDTAVEVYNTKNKYICISFGIIQEYIDWYAQNGIASNPARSDMQEQGLYDGQSYSCVGFIFPNEPVAAAQKNEYAFCVDDVENICGMDFFSKLPDTIENDKKKKISWSLVN